MTVLDGAVMVWIGAQGIPERFVWAGTRYRISDTPTPLEPDYAHITHPVIAAPGWRFQGTSDAGDSRMFDVLFDEARNEWVLLHTYE